MQEGSGFETSKRMWAWARKSLLKKRRKEKLRKPKKFSPRPWPLVPCIYFFLIAMEFVHVFQGKQETNKKLLRESGLKVVSSRICSHSGWIYVADITPEKWKIG